MKEPTKSPANHWKGHTIQFTSESIRLFVYSIHDRGLTNLTSRGLGSWCLIPFDLCPVNPTFRYIFTQFLSTLNSHDFLDTWNDLVEECFTPDAGTVGLTKTEDVNLVCSNSDPRPCKTFSNRK